MFLQQIVTDYTADGVRMKDLVIRIVLSPPFRMRRGTEEAM